MKSKTAFEKIVSQVERKSYNRWLKKQGKPTKEEIYWMFTGIRAFNEHEIIRYPGEQIDPVSEEEKKKFYTF